VLAGGVLASGCLPPPMNVGYVAMDPAGQGHVDVQGQVGGGAWVSASPYGGGGVAGHAEPFVADRVSIPIGIGLGVAGDRWETIGLLPVRVGVRHRAARNFAWGVGLGPSIGFAELGAGISGVADLELIAGLQRHNIGFSFGIRPAFSFDGYGMTFYGLLEPTLAIPVGSRRTSLTVSVLGGPWVTVSGGGNFVGSAWYSGFLGAAVGLYRRF
jgi:hypothetical protein